MELNKIYNESCIDTMDRMKSHGIQPDLVVTSPPYDDMRKYKGTSDFDFESTAELLFDVVADGGVVVWVVGDQTIKGNETGTSFKQALHFKEVGFNLYDTMIYAKNGSGAVGSNKQYFQSFEFMFVLSKGLPKTIVLLKDVRNKHAGNKISKAGRRGKDDEVDLTPGRYTISEFTRRTNIWTYATGWKNSAKDAIAFQHPAIFPEKLAHDHIVSWSNEGDLVYDPFMGSGTTAKAAKLTNRQHLGSEINLDYCRIAEQRLEFGDLFTEDV